mmetsp:Transcript_8113/g.11683  ORF Transcript_8113/g.11683 Transcript_8113/m.11683 type:complete len:361 (+) Transcript_8113:63-1145(+)
MKIKTMRKGSSSLGSSATGSPRLSILLVTLILFCTTGWLLTMTGALGGHGNRLEEQESSAFAPVPKTSSFALAAKESLGFFLDIPEETWNRHKQRFQFTQPNYMQKALERTSRHSNHFWAGNFEPEFTCPHEFRLGKLGDGGKWACDPHRILSDTGRSGVGHDAHNPWKDNENNTNSCLVYSVGSNGNFDFEVEVLNHVSPNCEIHTFDMKEKGRNKNFTQEAAKLPGVTFHHIGLGPAKPPHQMHFKSFGEIISHLKHENRIVDLMKIDCERCEYDQFRTWLADWDKMGMLVRQVLLEVHNSDYPGVVDIFREFQKAGYILFHKEANFINNANCVEVAWIKLSQDFQIASNQTIAIDTR